MELALGTRVVTVAMVRLLAFVVAVVWSRLTGSRGRSIRLAPGGDA